MKSSSGSWVCSARHSFVIGVTVFIVAKGRLPCGEAGIPCFSNRRLQELEKSVISNTATLRGPVFHANHRFFNQSISRYVLIAYYVQRWFTMESLAQPP